jgi:two-component system OmpR family sensor kinase
MNPPIRRRLLFWLSPTLVLAAVAFAVPTYVNVREEVDELFDKVLQDLAHSLQDSAVVAGETQSRRIPPPAAHDLDLMSQTWSPDGQLRSRSHPFPPLPLEPAEGWTTRDWRGEPWRAFTLKTPDGWIQVAQSREERRETANEIALRLLTPLLVLLPGLAVLIWLGLGRGLRPLRDLTRTVEKRSPEALQPIPPEGWPREVGTLVNALNGLLYRLDEALAAQRQFTADAAHELRTPLTALSLQAQVAERAVDPEKRAAALRALRQGIGRASHLVDQLLTLARLDPEAAEAPRVPLRLDDLARTVVGDYSLLAAERGIDLGLAVAEPALVAGDGGALRILLGTLLDNALRYTPAGGRVDVSVRAKGDAVWLDVRDTGPGIPESERTRVFDRFYRGTDQAEPGSGLGLAIARRIADRHGAAIGLADGATGSGLKLSVQFPAYRS